MALVQNTFLDRPLCRECGGRCCQGSPGLWVDPERFMTLFFEGRRMTLGQLRERLPALGLVLWEKRGVPMPAPRAVASGCGFLEADGCRLPVAGRPCQCLAMIPARETLEQPQGCLCQLPGAFSRGEALRRWRNYWQSL